MNFWVFFGNIHRSAAQKGMFLFSFPKNVFGKKWFDVFFFFFARLARVGCACVVKCCFCYFFLKYVGAVTSTNADTNTNIGIGNKIYVFDNK